MLQRERIGGGLLGVDIRWPRQSSVPISEMVKDHLTLLRQAENWSKAKKYLILRS